MSRVHVPACVRCGEVFCLEFMYLLVFVVGRCCVYSYVPACVRCREVLCLEFMYLLVFVVGRYCVYSSCTCLCSL